MLHPETIDLANSTILQTSPAEILHIPRQYSQHVSDDTLAHDSQRVLDCETLEVMAGVDPGLDVLDERNHLEEVLVDCALWWRGGVIPGYHALKWLILFVLPIVPLRIDSFFDSHSFPPTVPRRDQRNPTWNTGVAARKPKSTLYT
jgi:hypothetical protein